ncbi:MAG: ABC transporter ATP-binding protein [Planctomycetota bacterium]|jgi:ABC-type multidrug transport system ATPase subunit
MIRVTNLTKSYGRFVAVRELSFTVAPGEAVALWGANGAGKTTVIRCLLGLLRHAGCIEIAGRDVRREGRAARRALGYVPQELALYDDLRLDELLRFFGRLKTAPPERGPFVLEAVGLADHRRKRVRELSGGMKQRLALATALLADPPLLVLDELTANLDTAAQQGFLGLLRDQKRLGKTVLFTSHRLEEVLGLADRALVLEAGRLVADCPPERLGVVADVGCTMRVVVNEDSMQRAAEVLRSQGFPVALNGHGMLIRVQPGGKAAPIAALARERIDVRDFEITEAWGGSDDAR